MWPMLAAVGPILGNGAVGGEIVGQDHRGWSYRNGAARDWTAVLVQVPDPYPVLQPPPAVAVLTSAQTASSGEAVVVMFRGRAQTRSFGEATSGVPTTNQSFELNDGALLLITVGRMADRTGQAYDDRIAPDEEVPISWTELGTERDPVLEAAGAWLRAEPACRR